MHKHPSQDPTVSPDNTFIMKRHAFPSCTHSSLRWKKSRRAHFSQTYVKKQKKNNKKQEQECCSLPISSLSSFPPSTSASCILYLSQFGLCVYDTSPRIHSLNGKPLSLMDLHKHARAQWQYNNVISTAWAVTPLKRIPTVAVYT